MITGNFALLAELSPKAVSDWYLAIYMDAVEWVELPNVIGMALFANGGRFTSKPYIASGAYVKRMSNYCQGCQYKPEVRYGDQACPMTTLYWNFLIKHQLMLGRNPRTRLMTANLSKISEEDQKLIQADAQRMLDNLNAL
jgi:deoxyribodipyrimidine photolyase-related protein